MPTKLSVKMEKSIQHCRKHVFSLLPIEEEKFANKCENNQQEEIERSS